ncbi:MAG: DUF58 domain-containing protein [Planctomycetota bacterium]
MTLFDPAFRSMVRQLARSPRRPRGAEEESVRARRRRASPSGTFTGHRGYAPGEDLRGLDWNAYARSGELFIKVLHEEDRRTLDILLDRSPSMDVGSPSRWDSARRLAAVIAGVALTRLDGVRLVAGNRVEAFHAHASFDVLFDTLDDLAIEPGTALDAVETWAARGLRGRLGWVSDFARPDEVVSGLARLGRARRVACGLVPVLAEDRAPTVDGYVELFDPEEARRVRLRVDARLRAAVADELAGLIRKQDAAFQAVGVPLIRQPVPKADSTDDPGCWLSGGWSEWI